MSARSLQEPERAEWPLVLLVEDEASIAEPFAAMLARSGLRTALAATGTDAIAFEAEQHPDVVLLDLGLPDIDGRDVCRRIRAESDVPIIMVTASGAVTDRVVGLELGADDYVVKPFVVHEVVARIRAVMRRTHRRAGGRPIEVQDLRIDPRTRRAWRGQSEVELTRKEFDLLVRLAADAGLGGHPRDAHVRRMGRELVRVHQDARRARRLASPQARRRSRGPPLHPDGARRRLPADHRARVIAMGLRARVLGAIAYILILATLAFGVPLGLSLSARVNAEVRTQAQQQADLVAAKASDLLAPSSRRQLWALARTCVRHAPRASDHRRSRRPCARGQRWPRRRSAPATRAGRSWLVR